MIGRRRVLPGSPLNYKWNYRLITTVDDNWLTEAFVCRGARAFSLSHHQKNKQRSLLLPTSVARARAP
jgi:hypothetical protein